MVERRQGVAVQEPDGTVTGYVMYVNKLIGPGAARGLTRVVYIDTQDA